MPKTTQTPKPEADATLKPYGGLPVHEEDGVAEIDITDGEEQAVVVGASGEVGAQSTNTVKDTPTEARERGSGGKTPRTAENVASEEKCHHGTQEGHTNAPENDA